MIGPAPGDFCWAPATASSSERRDEQRTRRKPSRCHRPPACFRPTDLPDRLADLRDADLRADVHEHALRAQRIHRAAHVLPPGHQIQVDDRPPAARRRPYSACSVSSGVRVVTQPEPVGDPVDVRVDADVLRGSRAPGSGPGSRSSVPTPGSVSSSSIVDGHPPADSASGSARRSASRAPPCSGRS